MHFPSTLVLVAAAAASVAHAQVTITQPTITQCATNTVTYAGSSGPYYVAVLNGADLCGDALAEFYNVEGTSVDYFANVASGSQVQIVVIDSSEQETYSELVTVGDGDASCLPGASTSSSSSSSSTPTSSDAPASYTPPARESSPASAMTYTPSSNNNNNNADTSNTDDTPVNAQSDSTGGATAVSASASLVLGAIVAVAALF